MIFCVKASGSQIQTIDCVCVCVCVCVCFVCVHISLSPTLPLSLSLNQVSELREMAKKHVAQEEMARFVEKTYGTKW